MIKIKIERDRNSNSNANGNTIAPTAMFCLLDMAGLDDWSGYLSHIADQSVTLQWTTQERK